MTIKGITKFVLWNLTIVTLLLSLVEITFRVFDIGMALNATYPGYVKDPHLPYKTEPNSTIVFKTDEFKVEYEHNSLGLRDTEHAFVKPGNTFRILGLGDSFTYGSAVAFEHTYLYQLEKKINIGMNSNLKAEIIKAGLPMYQPMSERILLEHYGQKFQPDLILVGILPNDIIGTYLSMDATAVVTDDGYLISKEADMFGTAGKWFYLHSQFARTLLSGIISKMREADGISNITNNDAVFNLAWKKIEEELSNMIALSKKITSNIVFVYIPQKNTLQDEDVPLVNRLLDFTKSNGVTFIDTSPGMRIAARNELLYWKEDNHCNQKGYSVIADIVYADLKSNELVPM
jgi:lysophospholipase L1-like esterase